MAAEEENTELVDQQGQHGHGYGLELTYGMDLGSTRATLVKGNKEITAPWRNFRGSYFSQRLSKITKAY